MSESEVRRWPKLRKAVGIGSWLSLLPIIGRAIERFREWVLWPFGDYEVLQDIRDSPTLNALWHAIVSNWLGPTVGLLSLVAYLAIRSRERQGTVASPATVDGLPDQIVSEILELERQNGRHIRIGELLESMQSRKFAPVHSVTVLPYLITMRRDGILGWDGPMLSPQHENVLEINAQIRTSHPQFAAVSLAGRSSRQAKLEIRFETTGVYRRTHGPRTHIRFGVYNASDVAAENVEVFLIEIQPQPQSSLGSFDPDLPYRVRRADTGAEGGNHHINPRQEERFDILWFWPHEQVGVMVDGIDTKRTATTTRPDTGWITSFGMMPGEHWHMTYRISCANADEQTVVFFVERVGNEVRATRI